jgi:hypothetical protein
VFPLQRVVELEAIGTDRSTRCAVVLPPWLGLRWVKVSADGKRIPEGIRQIIDQDSGDAIPQSSPALATWKNN